MDGVEEQERGPRSDELEAEIAQVCGVLNAATARLVSLIAEVLERETWQVTGIHSPNQWVAWQCGVSPSRARSLVAMARRRAELPAISAAFDAGELCEDQVAVICRRAPASVDGQVAELARVSTVAELRRVLAGYAFEDPKPEPAPDSPPEETRTVSFGHTASGSWRLSAELPADEGALVERALVAARDERFRAGGGGAGTRGDAEQAPAAAEVSWADAFVAMAERSLGATATTRPHHERRLVLLHVGSSADGRTGAHLHLGPAVGEGLRRFVGCDARIRPVLESGGRPVSVGRPFRTVPEGTRTVIEDRDRGCRVPGCDRNRWLHVHHIVHWEDGGASDTTNLLALCRRHHRLHHLGHLGIRGDADDPDGVVFTDHRGWELESSGRPVPPRRPVEAAAADLGIPAGAWSHPTGEHLDTRVIFFDERAGRDGCAVLEAGHRLGAEVDDDPALGA